VKRLLGALLCVMLVAQPLWAQPAQAGVSAQPGRVKIWLGATLAVAGAACVVSQIGVRDGSNTRKNVGVGLLFGAGVLLLWGFHERRRATSAPTGVGVTLGHSH
jgi:hypothetical protein